MIKWKMLSLNRCRYCSWRTKNAQRCSTWKFSNTRIWSKEKEILCFCHCWGILIFILSLSNHWDRQVRDFFGEFMVQLNEQLNKFDERIERKVFDFAFFSVCLGSCCFCFWKTFARQISKERSRFNSRSNEKRFRNLLIFN